MQYTEVYCKYNIVYPKFNLNFKGTDIAIPGINRYMHVWKFYCSWSTVYWEKICIRNTCIRNTLYEKGCKCVLHMYFQLSAFSAGRMQCTQYRQHVWNINFHLRHLKGLSHEIFVPVFWAVWMYLGLNVNRMLFLNFNDTPLILDNYFKFWRFSDQTFSKILRISVKDWQLSLRFSNFRRFLVRGSPIFID
jgi:hypothetical protein